MKRMSFSCGAARRDREGGVVYAEVYFRRHRVKLKELVRNESLFRSHLEGAGWLPFQRVACFKQPPFVVRLLSL